MLVVLTMCVEWRVFGHLKEIEVSDEIVSSHRLLSRTERLFGASESDRRAVERSGTVEVGTDTLIFRVVGLQVGVDEIELFSATQSLVVVEHVHQSGIVFQVLGEK